MAAMQRRHVALSLNGLDGRIRLNNRLVKTSSKDGLRRSDFPGGQRGMGNPPARWVRYYQHTPCTSSCFASPIFIMET